MYTYTIVHTLYIRNFNFFIFIITLIIINVHLHEYSRRQSNTGLRSAPSIMIRRVGS